MTRVAIIIAVDSDDSADPLALTRSVISVRAQTLADFSLYVVAPARNEAAMTEAEVHVADPRLNILSAVERSEGLLNAAMARIDAEFVAFCPAGTVWSPDTLATHVRHLASDKRIGVSFCGMERQHQARRAMRKPAAALPAKLNTDAVLALGAERLAGAAVARHDALNALARERGRWFLPELGTACESEVWALLASRAEWKCEQMSNVLVKRSPFLHWPRDRILRQSNEWEALRAVLGAEIPTFGTEGRRGWAAHLLEIAQRASMMGERGLAAKLLARAVSVAPRVALDAPRRAAAVAARAAVLYLLGRDGTARAERLAHRAAGQVSFGISKGAGPR